ncbi:HNH endonuclease [Gemmata sp.]|uniref:HNH endonuclease n=1 Tax=Gemmata sp. TaxID=1914242 RepID=UPI003F6F1C2A
MQVVLSWVERGILVIESDGTVWRCAVMTRWGARPVARRRVDPIGTGGYRRVKVTEQYQQYCVSAHRLVWTHHNGMIPDGMDINHLDAVRGNNHPKNLEAVTRSGNAKHAHKVGSYKDRKRRFSPEVEAEIRRLRASGLSWRKVGAHTGVSPTWCRQFVARHGLVAAPEVLLVNRTGGA